MCEHDVCALYVWALYVSTNTEKHEKYHEKWTWVLGPDVAEHRKAGKLLRKMNISSWAGCCRTPKSTKLTRKNRLQFLGRMLQRQKRQKSTSFILKTPVKSIGEHRKVRELPRKINIIEEVEEPKKYENLQTKPVLDPFKSTADTRKVRELRRKMNIEEVEEPETTKIYRQNPFTPAAAEPKLRKFTDETNMQARNHENSDGFRTQPVRRLDLATPAFYPYRKNPKCYHTVWGMFRKFSWKTSDMIVFLPQVCLGKWLFGSRPRNHIGYTSQPKHGLANHTWVTNQRIHTQIGLSHPHPVFTSHIFVFTLYSRFSGHHPVFTSTPLFSRPHPVFTYTLCFHVHTFVFESIWPNGLRTHFRVQMVPQVINEILPGMEEFDRSYRPNGSVDINNDTKNHYVNIEQAFHTGTLSIVPRNGVRYWHQDFDDPDVLSPYSNTERVSYPAYNSYKLGGHWTRHYRHHIGRAPGWETNRNIIKFNQKASWVLLDDLLRLDHLWKDDEDHENAPSRNPAYAKRIKRARTALIVDLTLAEYREKGKSRFQILGLKADEQQSLRDIINAYKVRPPTPADDPLGEDGWGMPVTIRATSGHSGGVTGK